LEVNFGIGQGLPRILMPEKEEEERKRRRRRTKKYCVFRKIWYILASYGLRRSIFCEEKEAD
jgi:hypothetical protein